MILFFYIQKFEFINSILIDWKIINISTKWYFFWFDIFADMLQRKNHL